MNAPHLACWTGKYDFLGGYPVLYARPESEPPFLTYADYTQAVGNSPESYLNHVQADGAEEGHFQLAALDIMGGQFYLWWHANYNDTRIVADSETLESILSADGFGQPFTDDLKRDARKLALEPQVEINRETVTVKIVTFTKWGGFYRLNYTINKDFPHTIKLENSEVLVPYDCGIMF